MVGISKYYCKKCERYHTRGKIYKEHLKYKEDKAQKTKDEDISDDDISEDDKEEMNKLANDIEQLEEISLDEIDIEVDFEELRTIAQRQVTRLLEKAHLTNNPKLYKREIKRLLFYEDAI